jgi:hypothetical protein
MKENTDGANDGGIHCMKENTDALMIEEYTA